MKHPSASLSSRGRGGRSGFTITEVMIAGAISLVVITAVLAVVLAVTRSTKKTEFLAEALQNSREVQEYLKREVSGAINTVDGATKLGLSFEIPNGSGRYAGLGYRVPICNPLKVTASAKQTDSALTVAVPAGVALAVGDYVVIPLPFTGSDLRVAAVDNGTVTTDRNLTLTLNKTIAAATAGEKKDVTVDAKKAIYVSIYRDRKFEVADAGGAAVTTLQWWENASDDTTSRTLSTQVAAAERYMFEPVPNDLSAAEPAKVHAVRWHFAYQGTNPSSGMLPGAQQHWDRNLSEGVLSARSGDPENPKGGGPNDAFTTVPTTSVETTTSVKTTSTKKTTTKKPTTTSVKTTSTTKTTTTSIKTTSTTKPSTTSIKTTSTTKPSTTKAPTTKPTTKPTTTVQQDG